MGRVNKITPELAEYIASIGVREHPVLTRCREETAASQGDRARMQISPEQGAFLGLLARIMSVDRAIEVGVFTGYSSLSVALALPDDGRLIACDVSEDFTRVARGYWEEADVADRIDLRLAPAVETLDSLLEEGAAGTFDLAFIDADKGGYDGYYERCLELVRPNGVVAIDNTLWDGRVVDPSDTTADTEAIRALSLKIRDDERVDFALTTIGDGVTLCVKR